MTCTAPDDGTGARVTDRPGYEHAPEGLRLSVHGHSDAGLFRRRAVSTPGCFDAGLASPADSIDHTANSQCGNAFRIAQAPNSMNGIINISEFRVNPGTAINLIDWPTRVQPYYDSNAHYASMLAAGTAELSALQQKLYAHNRYAVLLIFQAMDAAGKDGAIRHVMSGVNPQGCQVFSFKHPSAEELNHDFLWRTHRALPERGRIGIFNRSYYEEVLIVRVRPEILAAQNLPVSVLNGNTLWEDRYASIVDAENHLARNGTRIIKFFLHLSKEEQRQRFLARIDDPDKNWKLSRADMAQRAAWDDYMTAYQDCLRATSTSAAPWYAVPADDKRNARLIISRVVIETLRDLNLHYPKATADHREELRAIRTRLEAEAGS
jgi:PPK2 family polyphosphate:nucleotide phosphotransferase